MPHNIRVADVGDGVVREIDSTMDDLIIREMANIILDDDVELASNVPISAEAIEGVPLWRWEMMQRLLRLLRICGRMGR